MICLKTCEEAFGIPISLLQPETIIIVPAGHVRCATGRIHGHGRL